jgi:hypothetical protein
MHSFLTGMSTAGCWAIGLLFFRLWRDSGDRLFVFFGAAFWVLSLNWIVLAITSPPEETRHLFYVTRLVAFLLIIAAIIDKNIRR